MLIDTSYFFGDLTIAQSSEGNVLANLREFINKYEVEYLQALLGRQMYNDFKLGLQANPVLPKWLSILYGSEFINFSGYPDYWRGLVNPLEDVSFNVYWPDDLEIVVGSGAAYAPVQDATAYHNPYLVGKQWNWERRGTGTVASTEFTRVSDGFTNVVPFQTGETFFIHFTQPVPLPSPAQVSDLQQKISPIANYIYFHYQKDNASFTTGSGEKKINQTSAVEVTVGHKMTKAWNQMVRWNTDLINFLQVNRETYLYTYPYYFYYDRRLSELLETTNMNGI